jgi:tetrahydromethanopterin S-methyltransferase subunit E
VFLSLLTCGETLTKKITTENYLKVVEIEKPFPSGISHYYAVTVQALNTCAENVRLGPERVNRPDIQQNCRQTRQFLNRRSVQK